MQISLFNDAAAPLTTYAKFAQFSQTKPPAEAGQTQDTVSISEQAKARSNALAKARGQALSTGNAGKDTTTEQLKNIRERIDKIKEEINKLEQSDLPAKEKNSKILSLNQELMLLQQQLSKLEAASGPAYLGGTVAKGMANSLT